jgi:hypothetical protein
MRKALGGLGIPAKRSAHGAHFTQNSKRKKKSRPKQPPASY